MGDGNLLSLRWNNHISNFKHTLEQLQKKSVFSDAMIACDGRFYPVHKFVLATCSDYFGSIFERMPCKHPVIILKDVTPREIEFLLSYMYGGEVRVSQADLPNLIRAAETLHIRGLAAPDDPPGCHMSGVNHKSKTIFTETKETPTKKLRLDCLPIVENEIRKIKTELDKENSSTDDDQDDPSREQDNRRTDSVYQKSDEEAFYVTKEKFPTELQVKEECEELLSQLDGTDSLDKSQIHQFVTTHEANKTLSSHLPDRFSSVNDDIFLSSSLHGQSRDPPFQAQESSRYETSQSVTNRSCSAMSGHLCPMCHKNFQSRADVVRHMRTHTGEKPFKCTHCNYRAALKGNLKSHILSRHSNLQTPFP